MKRYLLFLLLFFCQPIYNHAQTYKLDSLLTQLEVKSDTQSISALLKVASSFHGRNVDSLLICAEKMILYSKQINYEADLADGFQLLTSYFHYHLSDNVTALLYIDSALNLNSKLERKLQQAQNLGIKGSIQSFGNTLQHRSAQVRDELFVCIRIISKGILLQSPVDLRGGAESLILGIMLRRKKSINLGIVN